MNMKLLVTALVSAATLACSGIASAGKEGWSSDFAAAKKLAAETKRTLLLNFTGSDWCGYCIALDQEVFSKPVFKEGVKDKFILVELDSPRDTSKLSAETIQQNKELEIRYQIKGPPSVILCDPEGKPFGVTGYNRLGAEDYVKHLNELLAAKTERDKWFATAAKATGLEKARALLNGLAVMGLDDGLLSAFYGDVIQEIKEADPNDDTGMAKAQAMRARLNALQAELDVRIKNGDFEGGVALLDKAIKTDDYPPEMIQQIMVVRATILAQQQKFDEAFKSLDEAKALAPGSRVAADIDQVKTQLESARKQAGAGSPAGAN
jgi:thioredoxin-related protein